MEYGGYMEFERFEGKILHADGIALNCGRSCLGYIFETKAVRKIYLPYFLCESVRDTAEKYGVEIGFYHIGRDFKPIIDFEVGNDEFLYIVNYYGQLTEEYVRQSIKNNKNIILDNAQDYFADPIAGVHTIYICRKYFGVPDGAILYTSFHNDTEYERDIVNNRMQFLMGRLEENASKFYEGYKYNDKYLEDRPVRRMSLISENILRAVDYESVKIRRSENWRYVSDRLSQYNALTPVKSEGPFAYPLLIDNGMKMKKRLSEKRIYLPTLWPNIIEECAEGTIEKEYASNILPIPIDQRYSLKDMKAMCEIVESEICKTGLEKE